MPRFVTATGPIAVVNPVTDEPTGEVIPFGTAMRIMFRDPRIQQGMDVFTAMDLRGKLVLAKEGDVSEISELEWSVLAPCFQRPQALGPDFVHSPDARKFFLAVLEAPTTDPRPKPEAPKEPA